jgi:hypothetical protein
MKEIEKEIKHAEMPVEIHDVYAPRHTTLIQTVAPTISSDYIARLLDKPHKKIQDDCTKMFDRLGIPAYKYTTIIPAAFDKEDKVYMLDKNLALTLSTYYSVTERYVLIQAMEAAEPKNVRIHKALASTDPAVTEFIEHLTERVQLAEAKTKEAIACRARISSQREASALGQLKGLSHYRAIEELRIKYLQRADSRGLVCPDKELKLLVQKLLGVRRLPALPVPKGCAIKGINYALMAIGLQTEAVEKEYINNLRGWETRVKRKFWPLNASRNGDGEYTGTVYHIISDDKHKKHSFFIRVSLRWTTATAVLVAEYYKQHAVKK